MPQLSAIAVGLINAFAAWGCLLAQVPAGNAPVLPLTSNDGTPFVRVAPPQSRTEWSCANWRTKDDWYVQGDSTGAEVTFRAVEPNDVGPIRLEVPGGALIGTNNGEWGGRLTFVDSVTGSHTSILEGNPVALFPSTSGVVLVEGLGHLTLRIGHVIRLRRRPNGRWAVQDTTDIHTAPSAATSVANDTIIVATTDGVVAVSPATHGIIRLFRDDEWYQMYATSVARRADGVIFVGMRRAIAVLTPSTAGYSESWLVPAQCRTLVKQAGYECACQR